MKHLVLYSAPKLKSPFQKSKNNICDCKMKFFKRSQHAGAYSFGFLLSKSGVLLALFVKQKWCTVSSDRNPIVQYMFSSWHRICPSKDFEKMSLKNAIEPKNLRFRGYEHPQIASSTPTFQKAAAALID